MTRRDRARALERERYYAAARWEPKSLSDQFRDLSTEFLRLEPGRRTKPRPKAIGEARGRAA